MSWFCDAHKAEHNRACGHGELNHPPHSHCTFDIWAPDTHSSMNNLAFSAYACHQDKIDEFVSLLATSGDPNDGEVQSVIAQYVGLDPDSLTSDEVEYIEREVAKRAY